MLDKPAFMVNRGSQDVLLLFLGRCRTVDVATVSRAGLSGF